MKFTIPIEPHTASRPRFSEKTGRVTKTYIDNAYRKWRKDFQNLFNQYLNETNNELLVYMATLKDGRPIINNHKIIDSFNGYIVRVVCVLKRPKHSRRTFPVASNTADIDNLYKAVTDSIFESKAFKYAGINDRWIQSIQSTKRYTMLGTDEKPHVEVEIKRIEVD